MASFPYVLYLRSPLEITLHFQVLAIHIGGCCCLVPSLESNSPPWVDAALCVLLTVLVNSVENICSRNLSQTLLCIAPSRLWSCSLEEQDTYKFSLLKTFRIPLYFHNHRHKNFESALWKDVEILTVWATVLPETAISLLSCSSCLMAILKASFFQCLYVTFFVF